MARRIDPERHRERRLAIIDAALTCFARKGVEGATTAEICREAGIGSGTFFHYFPTKLDVLLAILALGAEETTAWFQAREGDPFEVLLAYADHVAEEVRDPRTAGFVVAVSAAMTHPGITQALEADRAALRDQLSLWATRAQRQGKVRKDWSTHDVVAWVMALEDGYVSAVATDPRFDQSRQAARLRDVLTRVLRPE